MLEAVTLSSLTFNKFIMAQKVKLIAGPFFGKIDKIKISKSKPLTIR